MFNLDVLNMALPHHHLLKQKKLCYQRLLKKLVIFQPIKCQKMVKTNWYWTLRKKCPNAEFFLVRIFLYSDWRKKNTDQKKHRIWRPSTQWKDKIITEELKWLHENLLLFQSIKLACNVCQRDYAQVLINELGLNNINTVNTK